METLNNMLQWYDDTLIIDFQDSFFVKRPEIVHVTPWTAVVLYIIMLVYLPGMVTKWTDGKGVGKIKWIMFFWNGALSLMSLGIMLGVGIPYFYSWVTKGVFEVICSADGKVHAPSPVQFWSLIFGLSKFVELFDTFFLIIRHPTRKVPELQWWHHITVLLFTWYAEYYQLSVGYVFIVMNATIHTFMYYYYAVAAVGSKPSWAFVLTMGQILQMVFGILFNGMWTYGYFKGYGCYCQQPNIVMVSCLIIYASYLYLFVKFAIKRYGSKPKKA